MQTRTESALHWQTRKTPVQQLFSFEHPTDVSMSMSRKCGANSYEPFPGPVRLSTH